jgi:peptidoglycan/LPS O-acetylase OafA/YrhL
MESAASSSNRRFVALDSLRGVCAILVAIHNFDYPQVAFVKHSSLFVDFFFVLSGFVITHSYMSRLKSGKEFKTFVLRRIGRLWPLHMTMLAAFVGLDVVKLVVIPLTHAEFVVPQFTPPNSVEGIIQNVLLIQAIGFHTDLSWNAPSWSISTEFWTYMLFSALCISSQNCSPSPFVMASVAIFSAIVVFCFSPIYLESNTSYAIFRCIYGFFVGHLVYRMSESGKRSMLDNSLLETLSASAIVGFVWFCDGPFSMAAPFIFGFAVWVFAHEGGHISKLLLGRWPVLLGTLSYSIYMVHWLIRNGISGAVRIVGALLGHPMAIHIPWNGQDPLWTMNAILVGYLVAVIGVAGLSYKLIEQPGRRFFNRISD